MDEAGEQRWHALGAVSVRPGVQAILLVVHAYRFANGKELPREDNDGEAIVRIISARRAGKNDVGRYQEQAMD